MHWHKQIPALLTGAALLVCGGLPVGAAGTAVSYEAVPGQTEVSTGDTVELSIRCTGAELDPAGVSLTLQVADGYAFSDAQAGSGIQSGEFSYSYRDGALILLYLDGDGGGSPVTPGQELATVTLVAGQAGTGAPLNSLAVDSAAVDGSGQVVSQQGSLEVGTLTVSGQTVPLPSPTPGGTEEGQPVRPTATPSATAAPSSTKAPSSTASPSATKAPSSTARPQTTPAATGGSAGTGSPSGSSGTGTATAAPAAGSTGGSAPAGQTTTGGQETASAASGSSTTAGSSQYNASSGSRGTPAPTMTTAPDGQVVQIFPEEEPVEPVDRTNEVLEAPAATTPQPTQAPAAADTAAEMAATPVLPAVAAVVLLVIIALGVLLWRRRH